MAILIITNGLFLTNFIDKSGHVLAKEINNTSFLSKTAKTIEESKINNNFNRLENKEKGKSLFVNNLKKENLSEGKKKLSTDLLKLIDNTIFSPESITQNISQMKNLNQFIGKAEDIKKADKRLINQKHEDLVYVYVNFKTNAPTSIIDGIAWQVTDRDEENRLAVA
jgi:hypothetical protein